MSVVLLEVQLTSTGIDQDTLDEFLDFVFEVMAAAVSDPHFLFLFLFFDIRFCLHLADGASS